MNPTQINKASTVIRQMYGLRRQITEQEVKAEIANLVRKKEKGNMDYMQEVMYARLCVKLRIGELSELVKELT